MKAEEEEAGGIVGDGLDMRDAPDMGPVPDTVIFNTVEEAREAVDHFMGEGTLDRLMSAQQTSVLSGEDGGHRPVTAYPDDNPKTAAGMKKPDLSVIPPAGILHLSLAMMNGANKYGPFNWREKRISYRPYLAAAMRHLLACLDGEDYSQDTVEAGNPVHHLGHVMACCAIALDAEEIGMLNDNRPKIKGPAGDMVERFNRDGRF